MYRCWGYNSGTMGIGSTTTPIDPSTAPVINIGPYYDAVSIHVSQHDNTMCAITHTGRVRFVFSLII